MIMLNQFGLYKNFNPFDSMIMRFIFFRKINLWMMIADGTMQKVTPEKSALDPT
jgi:hypothetical protein